VASGSRASGAVSADAGPALRRVEERPAVVESAKAPSAAAGSEEDGRSGAKSWSWACWATSAGASASASMAGGRRGMQERGRGGGRPSMAGRRRQLLVLEKEEERNPN
jgi:hypothetical protein